MGGPPTGEKGIYVISRNGGSPEQIAAGPCDNPYWSPDNSALLFQTEGGATRLVSFDLASRRSSPLPGSEDLY